MKTAVLVWSIPLFIIAEGQSMDTRGIATNNNTNFPTKLGGGIRGIQDLANRQGCIPTKSCKYAGGHCVKRWNQCDGKVDSRGCRGGKRCKCCIPACGKIPDSKCVARQTYWGDCPPDMHYSPGSCQHPEQKICCKQNSWCGMRLTTTSAYCYRTDYSTDSGCPMPLFPQLDSNLTCPKPGMSCCRAIPDQYCTCDRWGYKGLCAEYGWSQFCPNFCAGNRQTPINLFPTKYENINGNAIIYTNYDESPNNLTCKNNGHYAKCFWNSDDVPTISGGNLGGTYIFDSMHWHIGCDDGTGSEHTVHNESYSAELHLVHYKAEYDNITMALNSEENDALAVLGIFIQVNDIDNNPVYDAITEKLVYINNGGDPPVTFSYNHTLYEFLPDLNEDCPFYRYYGSLTHPACNEVVVWTVFQNPSYMSKYQIRPFRCMKTGPDGFPLCNNHRKIQPLNDREITLWRGSIT